MSFMMLYMLFIVIPRASVSAKRINEVLDAENQLQDPVKSVSMPKGPAELEFDQVSFRYAGAEEVYRAAHLARADSFIRQLPDGYETLLNEEGTNISQGQRQLLTIARAFLADPEILILDEATSSVDTRTESLIQKVMADLKQERTSFVIAHRLSTIQDADKIIVINHGQIVESGNHQSLLAKGSFYADLYQSQFLGQEI
ncbi:ATP-binding cassette domain-containing protein [Lactobacillus delbrueckii subsp. bulgaricus]|nr:ATP-binding cassette domain-containing protein [Lactobacillus delbrueckii subsp. bulgaricus]